MFQDIAPHVYHNEYEQREARPDDYLVRIRGRSLLMKGEGTAAVLPTVGEIAERWPEAAGDAFYLFSIDERGFFCAPEQNSASEKQADVPEAEAVFEPGEGEELRYIPLMALREMEHSAMAFGAATAWQLADWYRLHRLCGTCGVKTVRSQTERAIVCPRCGHAYYPRISPVVIVAITDGDRILLTRYSRGYVRRHSLVAGFVEIGETLEDAVRREVYEEVGLHVKRITYCESQPWAFSSSLIMGFFAEVDGDPTVRLNTDGGDELAEGVWIHRDDLEIEDSSVSLTWDMIRRFKEKREQLNAER